MAYAFQKMNGEPPFDTERMNRDLEEFREICRPVVEYLQKKHHPHAHIVIDWDGTMLTEDLCGVPFEVPD